MFLCSICSQLFGRGSERMCATKCGHVFHGDCIHEWLESSHSCPDCREYCSKNEVIVIYMTQMAVMPAEKIDEVSRLNDIRCKGSEIIQAIEEKLMEKMSLEQYLSPKSYKFLKDLFDDVRKLKDLHILIQGVIGTLNDVYVRGKDIFDRYADIKDNGQSLKILAEYTAKLQRDLDCCVNDYRRMQGNSYENTFENINLRCENTTLEYNLKQLDGKVQFLNSCIELLRNEIEEKTKIIKEEVDSKRKIVIEMSELNDKNKELVHKLETSEASIIPVLGNIKRLNALLNQKTELLALHVKRVSDLEFIMSEMEQKIQVLQYRLNGKCEQKDEIIREQRKCLKTFVLNSNELNEKIKDQERKICLYETIIRRTVEGNGDSNASPDPGIASPSVNYEQKIDEI